MDTPALARWRGRLSNFAAIALIVFLLAALEAPVYAGEVWLLATDAVSCRNDDFMPQLFANLKGLATMPILFINTLGITGSTMLNGLPLFGSSTLNGQNFSKFSAIVFATPSCGADPATQASYAIPANAAALGSYLQSGGVIVIEAYQANPAWIPVLGFDGTAGILSSSPSSKPAFSTATGVSLGFNGDGTSGPDEYVDSGFVLAAYSNSFFGQFGFVDVIDASSATGIPDVSAVLTMVSDPDTFRTNYFDVGTSSLISAAGYGGPGSSGGFGDNSLRIANGSSRNLSLCAMIYVFDDTERMQACCACPVTPDGLRSMSALSDLTFDFGANRGDLQAGTIEIVSSFPNFTPGNPPPAPNPLGANGVCSPSGISSNDRFRRVTRVNPAPGLRAWITHDELLRPGTIQGRASIAGVSMDEFPDVPLDAAHLAFLQAHCGALLQNSSGAGICDCGAGQDSPIPVRMHGR